MRDFDIPSVVETSRAVQDGEDEDVTGRRSSSLWFQEERGSLYSVNPLREGGTILVGESDVRLEKAPGKEEDKEEAMVTTLSAELVKEGIRIIQQGLFAGEYSMPTLFDVLGTVLNNAGLILTDVSVYQMLRGSVILFTALASRALFRRPFTEVDLQGLGLVGVGILCIGLANTIFWDYSAHHGHMAMRRGEYAPWPAMGNFLIILSQALMAGLFIAEELLLKERHLPPLRLVAWEGSLGVAFNAALLLLTLLLPGPDAGALENPVHATLQLFHSPLIFVAVSVMALSLLAFNLAGVYITKFQTATHRECVDATRQVLVWAHALAVGWEAFNRTELLGYALLLLGTLQYSGVVELPLIHAWLRRKGYAPI